MVELDKVEVDEPDVRHVRPTRERQARTPRQTRTTWVSLDEREDAETVTTSVSESSRVAQRTCPRTSLFAIFSALACGAVLGASALLVLGSLDQRRAALRLAVHPAGPPSSVSPPQPAAHSTGSRPPPAAQASKPLPPTPVSIRPTPPLPVPRPPALPPPPEAPPPVPGEYGPTSLLSDFPIHQGASPPSHYPS